jgi:flagellar biosynthesis protein FlhA
MTEHKRNSSSESGQVQNDLFWIPAPLVVELGSQLAVWVQSQQILQEQIKNLRQEISREYGVPIPPVRLRGATDLSPNSYRIFVYDNEVAKGEIMFDHLLAIDKEKSKRPIGGIEALNPIDGVAAYWIESSNQQYALEAGYRVVDAASVLVTHLARVIKDHLERFLGLQETQNLLDTLRVTYPAIVDALGRTLLDSVDIYNVLKTLLRDRVSIRDLPLVFTTLADHGRGTKEIDLLVRHVRQTLRYR